MTFSACDTYEESVVSEIHELKLVVATLVFYSRKSAKFLRTIKIELDEFTKNALNELAGIQDKLECFNGCFESKCYEKLEGCFHSLQTQKFMDRV